MKIVSTTNEWSKKELDVWEQRFSDEIEIYTQIEDISNQVREQTDVLLTFGNDLTPENVKTFSSLKWVQILSAGLEDLPVDELNERRITVTNAKGVHTYSMREYILGAMLHFEKHFDRFVKDKKEKKWRRETFVGELIGKKALVFGTGTIGSHTAEALQFFGLEVDGVNTDGRAIHPFRSVYSIQNVFHNIEDYDYVILLLPLTPETKGIFDRKKLERLSEHTVLMNLGRGGLIDETSLISCLKDNQIHGAVLDVFIQEPLPADHPFWELDNVLLTPHMSAKSEHYLSRCMNIFVHNYECFLHEHWDEMKNRVEVKRYY